MEFEHTEQMINELLEMAMEEDDEKTIQILLLVQIGMLRDAVAEVDGLQRETLKKLRGE